ncbi:hypothetical protein CEN47_18425 [Fischerella thermalis CCMEE 5319]|jgi:hypothetical protein|nr:hypothetical protein CEN47_18425 [Fischerella thermalis CCMEE 5319]
MQDWQSVFLGASVFGGLVVAGWLDYYYVDKGKNGCVVLPLQFIVTSATIFFATSIAAGGIQVWLGWRLLGAIIVGLGSSAAMYRARQITNAKRQKE